MTAAAIAASSAREMVLVIPMPFGLHSGKHLSEGGKRLILCLALLRSFGGCQKRSCCTPFHEVGIAYVSFVLGMKPSVVQYFKLSRTNALWAALMLLFSQLGRNIRRQLLARYTSQIVWSVART